MIILESFPTLLERDFNIPPLDELLNEVEKIGAIQSEFGFDKDEQHHKTTQSLIIFVTCNMPLPGICVTRTIHLPQMILNNDA